MISKKDPLIFDRKIFSWMLYDWASSTVPTLHTSFIFAVYFTTVISPENGTFYWAMMTGGAALATAIAAPILGHIADQKGHIKGPLFICTLITVIAVCALWFVHPDKAAIWLALSLSGMVIFFSEIAFVYYNVLLLKLVPRQQIGRISGYGWGLGYIGAIIALGLVLMLFLLPSTPLFNLNNEKAEPVRASMIFTGLWLLVFSLPLFLGIADKPKNTDHQPFFKTLKTGLQQALFIEDMIRFLLARMAYSDGLITLFAFGGIYAAQIFDLSQKQILLFAIGLNITAGIGAIAGGALTDKWGAIRLIRISLLAMFSFGLICLLTTDVRLFFVASLSLGLFIGPCQAAGRVWVGKRAPPQHQASLFGFLALSGKLTSFIGPILYGWLVYSTGMERAGMGVVLALFLLGFILLPASKAQKPH